MENVKITELALSLFDITAKYSITVKKSEVRCFKLGLLLSKEGTVSFLNDKQTPAPFTEWKCWKVVNFPQTVLGLHI